MEPVTLPAAAGMPPHVEEASTLQKVSHYFYSKIQFHNRVRPGMKPKSTSASKAATEEVKQQ